MRYTFKDFKTEYPDDDACLEAVFQNRYGDLKYCPRCGVSDTKFYRVKKRQCYACMHCGHQLHPLAKTIFRKSSTSLWNWFYAIYLFSVSKNGVSAKELQRHLGVTYKTAWRMCKQIRLLMAEEFDAPLGRDGTSVEADETYIGGRARGGKAYDNKTAVFGAVERHGMARSSVTDVASKVRIAAFLKAHVRVGAELHTDESRLYIHTKNSYKHKYVSHKKGIYVKKGVHTNTIEGLWGQMKRSMDGTYHYISPKYMQNYVNEFTFRYNYRNLPICRLLLERV
jgi:transposase